MDSPPTAALESGRHHDTGSASLPIVSQRDACADPGSQPLMPAGEAMALADILKALADPTRVRLIDHLAGVPGGTVCACHLPGQLGISQPTLSHHLKKLVDAGILTREQRGRWAHYTVVSAPLERLTAFLDATSTSHQT